jgi:hypothetical protein
LTRSTSVTHADAAPSNPAIARNEKQRQRKGKTLLVR